MPNTPRSPRRWTTAASRVQRQRPHRALGNTPRDRLPHREVTSSQALGGVWLLDALWRRLGIGEALGGVLGARRFGTDIERVLFAMVSNRALDPCSKRACSEWAREDVAIPGIAGIDEDHCYRAMDLLVDADTEGKVQEAVFFACADLLNLEVDLLFFDTTSTYFERDGPWGTLERKVPVRPARLSWAGAGLRSAGAVVRAYACARGLSPPALAA